MGKARWWVCGSCSSLNDMPANKCYACGASKPSHPTLIDDSYSEVKGQRRVGVTVDRSQVSDLVRPDPIAEQAGGGIIEAFASEQERASAAGAPAPPRPPPYDPYGAGDDDTVPSAPKQRPVVPPLREPTPRGIEQVGGRHWTEGLGAMRPDQPPAAPPTPPPAERSEDR